jgi:hypothetical protein
VADVSITIGAKDEASPTIKRVADNVGEIEKKSGGAAKALGDVAKIASGFVVAQGLMKLPGLLSGFVSGASDLNESLSKVNTVFGANAKEIESWASTAAKNLGMSKGAALEAAGTFGNFLQAMGATTPAATAMSKSMVELATDLGSFNNADPTEVLLALRSGLSGEAEPLRKFGVALSEAAVKAKALELGIGTVGKELTEQEKIQARYAIIMEQTTMAQGDFERTSGGLANQTKILKASFKDAADQLGTAMLPAVVAVMGALIQLLPYAISVGQAIGGKFLDAIQSVGSSIGTFIGNVKWLIENGGSLMDIVAGDNEPTFWQKLAFAVSQVLPALKEIAGMTWEALTDLGGLLKDLAGIAWGGLVAGFTAIKDFASAEIAPRISSIAASIKEIAQASIAHVAPQFDALKSAIAGVSLKDLSDGFQTLKEKIQPAIDVLQPLVERDLKALKQAAIDVSKEFGPLKKALEDFLAALKPLEPIIEPLAKVLGTTLVIQIGFLLIQLEILIKVLSVAIKAAIAIAVVQIELITKAIEGVTKVVQKFGPDVGAAMGNVGAAFRANIEFIIGYFQPLMNIGSAVIDGIVNGIQAGFGRVRDAARQMVEAIEGAIPDWIPHSPSVAGVKIGEGFIDGLVQGFVNELPVLLDAMTGVVKAVWDRTTSTWKAATGMAQPFMIPPVTAGGFGQHIETDPMGGGFAGQAILGSDGKWYKSEADMPSGVTGASSGGDPNAKTKNGSSTSYIGGGQTAGLPHMPNVGDTFNGMTWNGTAWIQGPSADTGSGDAQHSTITVHIGTVNTASKGDAYQLGNDIGYALLTRGL